jgi:probable HAF family extracellular repeat protein
MQSITKILIFCIAMFLCNIQAQAAFFQGLGDHSRSKDISLDGSTVVGLRVFGSTEAFLWTEEHGMVGLGDLSGGDFYSNAEGVSADGSIVVGFSRSGSGREACLWTQYDGMVGLGDLPGGVFDSVAFGISADRSTVVGFSNSDLGTEAFL